MSRNAAITLAIVGVLLVAAIGGAFVFGGPFVRYWKQRTADAEASAEHGVDDAVGRGLETQGTAAIAAADGQDRQTVVIIRESAHELELESRQDVNAATRLPDSVLDRLGAGDRLLCDSGVECRSGRGAAEPGPPAEGARDVPGDND